MKTILITDSCSDLPIEFVETSTLQILNFSVNYKGEDYKDDFGKTIKYKGFYDALRAGEITTTSQINIQRYEECFRKNVLEGNSIIYLGFSSALSGSFNSASIAKNDILEEFSNADINIIDTKSASLGQGLIVYYAYNMLMEGHSKEEIINWVESNKLKVNHWFTVDDLNHLKRGGRISYTAATIGTLLNIKPILYIDDDGKLESYGKAKGRKKSLRVLADKFLQKAVNPTEQVVFISHGDCFDDAQFLVSLILQKSKVKDIIINNVGPVIGTHAGPGTVALFFLGNDRN